MASPREVSPSGVIQGKTEAGTGFATLRIQPGGPAPTLLLFAMGAVQSLTIESFNRTGALLHEKGWNVVSLDMPCHGDDLRTGEPPVEIQGWAGRLGAGENIVLTFQKNVNDVVGHLIKRGVIDARRLAALGTSRGAFMAFHAASANPSIRAVAALAPVSDLREVSEFAAVKCHPLMELVMLDNIVESLADRWSWITIGNNDDRVGSVSVVRFTNALTAANLKIRAKSGVTLRLLPTPGHSSFPAWHDDAAEWLTKSVVWE